MKGLKLDILAILITCCCIHCTVIPEPGSPDHIKKLTSGIDDDRLVNIETIENEWLTYGGNYQEDRYSSINQINKLF